MILPGPAAGAWTAALLTVSGIAMPAGNEDAAFVGTWGVDAAQCATPQDLPNAPIVMTRRGYDRHETHCRFQRTDRISGGWSVHATCLVEGAGMEVRFRLERSGPDLVITEDGHARRFRRC